MHFIMTTQGRPGARLPLDAARIVAVALTYVVAAKLGLSLATVGVTVSLVWPASGVAVAAVLLFGERMLVGVALGAFVANVTTPVPLGLVAAATIGNTLEALVATRLLRRAGFNLRLRRRPPLHRGRDVRERRPGPHRTVPLERFPAHLGNLVGGRRGRHPAGED